MNSQNKTKKDLKVGKVPKKGMTLSKHEKNQLNLEIINSHLELIKFCIEHKDSFDRKVLEDCLTTFTQTVKTLNENLSKN